MLSKDLESSNQRSIWAQIKDCLYIRYLIFTYLVLFCFFIFCKLWKREPTKPQQGPTKNQPELPFFDSCVILVNPWRVPGEFLVVFDWFLVGCGLFTFYKTLFIYFFCCQVNFFFWVECDTQLNVHGRLLYIILNLSEDVAHLHTLMNVLWESVKHPQLLL